MKLMRRMALRVLATLLLSVVAGLATPIASAQKQLTNEELQDWLRQTRDFEIRHLKLRAPAPYTLEMGQFPYTRQDPTTLHFQFWISDGKPLWNGAFNAINARDLIGQPLTSFAGMYWFWPPEPGRPAILSGSDFLVHVVALGRTPDGIEGQKRVRGSEQRLIQSRVRVDYGSLQCGMNRTPGFRGSPVICANPFDQDPAVYVSGGFPVHLKEGYLSSLEMYLYSRADAIDVRLVFPEAGLPRWSEVVCRTLSLIRMWRVNGGPPPGDCTKDPRMTFKTSGEKPRG